MTAPHYHSHVDDPAAVGRRLKDARLAAGLSQRQLSFPGCSAAYISRLEAGDRVPSLQLLRKLAAKLNADEQFLATGVEQVHQDPPELVAAEVERRLAGGATTRENGRPAGGLDDPAAARECSGSTPAHSRPAATPSSRRGTPAMRSRCSTSPTTSAHALRRRAEPTGSARSGG